MASCCNSGVWSVKATHTYKLDSVGRKPFRDQPDSVYFVRYTGLGKSIVQSGFKFIQSTEMKDAKPRNLCRIEAKQYYSLQELLAYEARHTRLWR